MTGATGQIDFQAKLLRPADRPAGEDWTFALLPKDASEKLPSRGLVTVEGTLNGEPFVLTLEADGRAGHWLKVNSVLGKAAGVKPGDTVEFRIRPVEQEPEPVVPRDLEAALDEAPAAKAQWAEITPKARRDWIYWIVTAGQDATRKRRIASTCDLLSSGKRRVCCFDQTGIYGKSKRIAAPEAADD